MFARMVAISVTVVCGLVGRAWGVGWDADDFIIGGTSTIGVYDRDFTFKGNLDGNFPWVSGLDFDADGNLVAAGGLRQGDGPVQFRVYNKNGTQIGGFENANFRNVFDLKVGTDGNYFLAIDNGPLEFTPAGALVRDYSTGRYTAVEILPGGILWAGLDRTNLSDGSIKDELRIFDIKTGALLGSRIVDAFQDRISSMFYDPATASVLMSDWFSPPDVYERDLNGNFIRSFSTPGGFGFGVTRGPNQEVYATVNAYPEVEQWAADGTYLRTFRLSHTDIGEILKIVWAGNAVPEPGTWLLGLAALIACDPLRFMCRRRRSRR